MKEWGGMEWRGAERIHGGEVVKSDMAPEGFSVRLDNGCTFQLKDLRYARSAKLIEV